MKTTLILVAVLVGCSAGEQSHMMPFPDFSTSIQVSNLNTMILKTNGSLWGSGYNTFGQLGDGTTQRRTEPVHIMDNVAAVSLGEYHTMIITRDRTLWATGSNGEGQLGDGTHEDRSTPVKIMENVAHVIVGPSGSTIIKTDGTVWTTGQHRQWDFQDSNNLNPVQVTSLR